MGHRRVGEDLDACKVDLDARARRRCLHLGLPCAHRRRRAEASFIEGAEVDALLGRLRQQLHGPPNDADLRVRMAFGQPRQCDVEVALADIAPRADQIEMDRDGQVGRHDRASEAVWGMATFFWGSRGR